jgi:hypothetical protein
MWQQEFTWFFALFHHEFRQGNRIAFEVLMALACAHLFGFYNPKQLADFLDIPHQKLSVHSMLKFFQVDSTGMLRMTSSARYFRDGVGSSRPS